MDVKAKIIDEDGLSRIITRMAHEILEKNKGSQNLVLMGMKTRGEFLAKRIFDKIKEVSAEKVSMDQNGNYLMQTLISYLSLEDLEYLSWIFLKNFYKIFAPFSTILSETTSPFSARNIFPLYIAF